MSSRRKGKKAALVVVTLNPYGRLLMTRDMELIRKIFSEIQSRTDLAPRKVHVTGYEEWIIERHLEMLIEAGFVEGQIMRPLGIMYPLVLVTDLSWDGHDFAAAMANEGV
jgi:uncharacterized protein YacL